MGYLYLLKKDIEDTRDYVHEVLDTTRIPRSIDLRGIMPPVFDQGQLGSCTANAGCGLDQYYQLAAGDDTALSRLFVYYKEREREHTVDEDSGAMIRDLMKVLTKVGACPESEVPYDINKFTVAPTEENVKDAAKYKLRHYHRVRTLSALKHALALKQPVVLGINIYDSFETEEVAKTGIIPIPDIYRETLLGGHAVLAVGFDDRTRMVIVRNSWGTSWGDKGYFYMPYDMFVSSFVTDMWTATL